MAIAGAILLSAINAGVQAQNPDPRYQTRTSDCRHKPPPGRTLAVRITDSRVTTQGYTATRVLTQSADASLLNGGELIVCTEYGRVEIADSDDGHVHLQIRIEASGEGSAQPTDDAKRVMADTHVHAFIHANQGRLMIRAWHSTLGFSTPGGQPAWMSVRLLVPARGSYRVTTEAFHGSVAIRRLSLAGATMRGNVGEKLKGIPGFIGPTELDNVELRGNVDIDNLAGLPGIRAPVPESMAATAAPILVKARVGANCELKAVTGGDINIAILPAPGLGVSAVGESNTGRVSINIDGGAASEPPGESPFSIRGLVTTEGFDTKAVRINVRAASGAGNVHIASIPAAPLARPPR